MEHDRHTEMKGAKMEKGTRVTCKVFGERMTGTVVGLVGSRALVLVDGYGTTAIWDNCVRLAK